MWRNILWSAYSGLHGFDRELRELATFKSFNEDEARIALASRLQRQIRNFGAREDALPEWNDAARIDDPDELWRQWHHLPILTKEMLRTRFPAHELPQRYGLRGLVSSTGGSTGEPTGYFHDEEMLRSCSTRVVYGRMSMGWKAAMPTISIWGSERDLGRQISRRKQLSEFCRNHWVVQGYQLNQETVDRVVTLINRLRPVALYGFTSMLEFVAREIVERGIRFCEGSVRVAWNGGEMLFPHQAELFQRAFGTPLLNCYGCRELSAIANQTEPGGPLHVLRPHQFLEIVDRNGRPAGPGESGRLILTSTVCKGTPFLRYEIGDIGVYESAYSDASGIRAISELQGRTAGLLTLPDGTVMNCLYWNHLLKEFPEIHQFQVAMCREGSIELRLTGPGLTQSREQSLLDMLRVRLRTIPLRIQWMERIPLTPQGKLVQVVREA